MAEQAPSDVRPTLLDRLVAILVIGIALVLIIRASQPNIHPELLPQIAGCYAGAPPYKQLRVRLYSSGELEAGGATDRFHVENSKRGFIILPDRGLVFDRANSGHLRVGSDRLILLLDSDLQGFQVPDPSGGLLSVHRAACQN